MAKAKADTATGKIAENAEILEYALRHLEKERDEIQIRIDGIRRQLERSSKKAAPAPAKRVLSEAARRRIAAAQKKRWAEHRKRQKTVSAK